MPYTFVMLKPDALDRGLVRPVLEKLMEEAGVRIVLLDYKKVTNGLLYAHYEEVIAKLGEPFRRRTGDFFTNRFVLPMVVESDSPMVIADVRRAVGATNPAEAQAWTIRGAFGDDSYERCEKEDRCCHNLIHASDSPEAARREIALWFGEETAVRYGEG